MVLARYHQLHRTMPVYNSPHFMQIPILFDLLHEELVSFAIQDHKPKGVSLLV